MTRSSGKSVNVEFRYVCSHPLRKATDDFALQSVRHSARARDYLKKQLALGHKKARAYRALANRWLKIIWTLWQRHKDYSEVKHTANRAHSSLLSGTPDLQRKPRSDKTTPSFLSRLTNGKKS